MKKLLIGVFFCVTYMAHAQQCENALYNFKEGATWELENFDKKDKSIGHTTYMLSGVSVSDESLKGQLHKTSFDDKNKQVGVADFSLQCRNVNFSIDMQSVISEKQFESYRKSDFKILKQDGLLFPKTIEIGSKLPNGQLNAELDTDEGTKAAKIFYETTERAVLKKESITVPAGTFECYKISTKVHSVTTIAGIGLNYDYVLIEWFAYGAGVVRSETYKKDKLETYSVLTKFSK